MSLDLRQIVPNSAEHEAAIVLRRRILRTPLGLDFTPEQLAAETGDVHLAALEEGKVVATLILTPYDAATLKLRQMAVAPEVEGQGIGSQLVCFAETFAREHGVSRIDLHARVSAQGFYEKNGYKAYGETFTEVTVLHIAMAKTL